MSNQFSDALRTGDYVTAHNEDVPRWAVVDDQTGKVITFTNTRKYARQFAEPKKGERIAKVHTVVYEVSK